MENILDLGKNSNLFNKYFRILKIGENDLKILKSCIVPKIKKKIIFLHNLQLLSHLIIFICHHEKKVDSISLIIPRPVVGGGPRNPIG